MYVHKLIVKKCTEDISEIVLKNNGFHSKNLPSVFRSFIHSNKYSVLYMYNNQVAKTHS